MNTNTIFEEDVKKEAVFEVARAMMIGARTAPKAKGVDHLSIAFVDEEGRKEIAHEMQNMVNNGEAASFFLRDAQNLLQSDGLILIGTSIHPMRLDNCGLCGFKNCNEKETYPNAPCAFNTGDLGIAVGSAVSIAADRRVDNRVMFSVGMAVKKLSLLGSDVQIVQGIVMSIKGKNIFFDRK